MTAFGGSGVARRGLRLTPWERYMALDNGPRHTMTCCSRFWLSRPVGRDAFVAAIAAAARDHPLLAAKLRGGAWTPVTFDPGRQVHWSDEAAPVALRHLPPDDTLVRWTVRVGRLGDLGLADGDTMKDHGTLVILRYPHAVADGLAAVAVMRQICGLLAGEQPGPPRRAGLEARHTLVGPAAAARRRVRHEVDRIVRYFLARPAVFPEAGRRPDHAMPPEIACERVALSTSATARLRDATRAAGVSLNDVLLAALFRTLGPVMGPQDLIRVAVPTSLRAGDDTTFCNAVSMVFLDRRAGRVADPTLLAGISAEMSHVKRWRLGHAMHSFLSLAVAGGDGPLHWFLGLPILPTTVVLSNLGDPCATWGSGVAPLRIVAHDLLPPLRPGTNLALAAVGHDGRLGLTARYAAESISAEQARSVLANTVAAAATLLGVDPAADGGAPLWAAQPSR